MRAGELDQRVKILRLETGVSSSGSGLSVEEWVQVARVAARVRPLSGSERSGDPSRIDSQTFTFRIRFREFDPSWRIEWRGEQYDVTSALPGGQRLREYLDVTGTASEAENPRA